MQGVAGHFVQVGSGGGGSGSVRRSMIRMYYKIVQRSVQIIVPRPACRPGPPLAVRPGCNAGGTACRPQRQDSGARSPRSGRHRRTAPGSAAADTGGRTTSRRAGRRRPRPSSFGPARARAGRRTPGHDETPGPPPTLAGGRDTGGLPLACCSGLRCRAYGLPCRDRATAAWTSVAARMAMNSQTMNSSARSTSIITRLRT